jgi:Flp pilus assembly protein TadD
VENDRAVADLQQGRLAEARRRLEGILRTAPRSPAARWNHALLEERSGNAAAARAEFAAIAAGGEAGWSAEAQQHLAGAAGP